jgi:lipid A ethanolaminephosphotransferase
MSLKLFRSTGYSSILAPGETRVAMHPAWAVAAVSAWTGLACNPWIWRALTGAELAGLQALAAGAGAMGVVGTVLSLLGWRRTFKPVATLLLLAAALLAAGVWTQDLTLEAALAGKRLGALLPNWASLFGWQAPTVLVLLGVLPVLWLWSLQLRRLTGPAQFSANLSGMFFWGLVALGGFVGLAILSGA